MWSKSVEFTFKEEKGGILFKAALLAVGAGSRAASGVDTYFF